MSEVERGKRAANFTNRHCFHLFCYLSVSVSASEDGLISSAPGLRFKHLSAFPPFPSTSSVSQPVSPRESSLLLSSITGMMREAVEDAGGCRGGKLLDGRTDGQDVYQSVSLSGDFAKPEQENPPLTSCVLNHTTNFLYVRRSNQNQNLTNEVRQWAWMLRSLLPLWAAFYGFMSLFRPPAALKRS